MFADGVFFINLNLEKMMLPVLQQLDAYVRAGIKSAYGIDADAVVTVATNERFGDYQANAAMGLTGAVSAAQGSKANPRQIAEKIVSMLEPNEMIEQVSIAGPGFINFKLSSSWLSQAIESADNDAHLGVPVAAESQTVVVDYSSPNVAKQMHVGHLRSTIIGDAIARVLEFEGHHVIRQNHIGDWGTQFGMLISWLRRSSIGSEAHIADLEHFYREAKKCFDEDKDFQEESRATVVRLQAGDPEVLAAWRRIVAESRRHYQPLYERLNVSLRPEDECGESFYNPMLESVVTDLLAQGLATESEGAIVVNVPGYDTPLIIRKTGGGYLYATTDLAAIRYRSEQLHANRCIYCTDSRQAQHFAMVFDTARRAGWAKDTRLEHAPFGTMLGEDRKPFKTRSGETVKLTDLLDEAETRAYEMVSQKSGDMTEEHKRAISVAVGIGAVKYSDLCMDRLGDYVFSWDKMLSMDGNTAPYMQYAHARVCSILRKGGVSLADALRGRVVLSTPTERSLAIGLLRLGDVLALLSRELKPHVLCTYLFDLSQRYNSFYEQCPVLNSEPSQRESRLALCAATARTIALGLDLLGIAHPEQM